MLNATTRNRCQAAFRKAAAFAILLFAVAAQAMAQNTGTDPSVAVTHNYNAETMTVTVSNPPTDGYMVVYTYSNTAADPDAPVADNPAAYGTEDYNGVGTIAFVGTATGSIPVGPTGDIAVGRDWTQVTVAIFAEGATPVSTAVCTTTVAINRYATPVRSLSADGYKIIITDGTGNPDNTRLTYDSPSAPGIVSTVEYNTTTHNVELPVDAQNLIPFTDYTMRTIGPATGATAYPSQPLECSTMAYHIPALIDFHPYHSGSSVRYATGTVVSGSMSAPVAKIYINYDRYEQDGVTLMDPNPYDVNTYNVALPSGSALRDANDQLGIPYPYFKMAAGPVDPAAESRLITSAVMVVDTLYSNYYLFSHTDGTTTHYLSFDPVSHNLANTTTFDYNCLWQRNPEDNHLYHLLGGHRYRLGIDDNGALTVHYNSETRDVWYRSGSQIFTMNGGERRNIAYRNGQWILTAEGTDDELNVAHQLKHEEVDAGQFTAFNRIETGDIKVPATSTVAEYAPNWLALDQNRTWTVQVSPRLYLDVYSLPPHEIFQFDDNLGSTNRLWYYNNTTYGSYADMPHRLSQPYSPAANDSRYTYTWSVVDAADQPSTVVTATPSASNPNQVTLTCRSDINSLHALTLKVELSYRDEAANANHEPVEGSTAAPTELALFAEHSVALTALTSVPNAIESGAQPFRTSNGSYLVRCLPDPTITPAQPYYDITAAPGEGDSPRAILTAVPDPERLLEVHYDAANQVITITDPALSVEHGTSNDYFLQPAPGQSNWNYLPETPALCFSTGGTSTDWGFKVTAYQNGSDAGYFTFRPAAATDDDLSVEPEMATRGQGNGLRFVNSVTSRTSDIYINAIGTFYASRWQLVDPTLIKPEITMTPDGEVTVTDVAGHLRHVYGTLHYQYKRAGDADWSTEQTFTLTQDGSYHVVVSDNNGVITFGEGDQVKAWKSAGSDHSYFAPSDEALFTVRRTPAPTLSVSAVEGHAHDIVITPGSTADIPAEGQLFSYTIGTSDPTDWSSTATLSDIYLPGTFTAWAAAPDCLKSEPSEAFVYSPKLMIGASAADNVQANAYDVIVYVGVPSTAAGNYREWADPDANTTFPETEHYVVRYTLDGSPVTATSSVCQLDETPDPSGHNYYVIPVLDGYANIRAKAFPTEGSPYEASDEFVYNFHANDYIIYDTLHTSDTEYHTYTLVPNGGQQATDNNIQNLKDNLDPRYLWIGNSTADQATGFRNKRTGKYLTLQRITDGQGETLTLVAGDSRVDGQGASGGAATTYSSSTWRWSGDEATDEAGRHRLYTVIDGTTYYLALDRAKAARNENPWVVIPASAESTLLEEGHARLRYNTHICFRTSPTNYRGGADFAAMSATVQIEQPINSNQWIDIADADNHGWASLAYGDSLHVRAVFKGDSIVYTGNNVIYIIRPGHDNGVDTSDFDHYIPWQFWLEFSENDYSQTPRWEQRIVENHFDSLSTVRWYLGTHDGTTATFNNTPFVTYVGHGTVYHRADTAVTTEGTLRSLFTWKHVRGANYLTLIHNRTANTAMPNFSTVFRVVALQNSVYTAGIAEAAVTFENKMHLFAEKVDSRANDNGVGEWPQFAGSKRWRFLSKDYDEATGDYHYLSSDHHHITRVDADRYPYLANQPRMSTNPEYTHYALWTLTSENVGSAGSPLYRVRISPAIARQKSLVHLPGNGLDAGGTDRGSFLYKQGLEPEPPAGVAPADYANGLFLHDPLSVEDVEYSSTYGYHELYSHSNDFQYFAIRQYEETDASGAVTAQYVTLSPFYHYAVGGATRNIADYLSLANADGEDSWVYSHFGKVPQPEGSDPADCRNAAINDFYHSRWHMDQAFLTPPYVEMRPSGEVTLWHRLEQVNNDDIGTEHHINDLGAILKYFYCINDASVSESSLVYPTFLDGETPITDQTPVSDMVTGPGTLLYDPAHKPVLTEGQHITVVAVLTEATTTPSFSYEPHISRPHTFEAVKSATPTWVDATAMTDVRFAVAEGDTLLIGQNVNDANYSIYADPASEVYGISTATASPRHIRNEGESDSYVLRAFQHNMLESDPLYFYQSEKLRLVATVGAVDATTGAATVTVTVSTLNDRTPLTDYYDLFYTTATPDSAESYVSVGSGNWTRVSGSDNSYTFVVSVLANNQPAALPLRIQARATGSHNFYTNSDIDLHFLIHPSYADTAFSGGGDGTPASPYIIANPIDLFTAAHIVNGGNTTAQPYFRVDADIDLQGEGSMPSIGTSGTPFAGHWNGGYHTIAGITKPLFGTVNGGHIYNVVIDRSTVVGTGTNTGAICEVADGEARIYNCGVRSTGDQPTTVTGSGVTGGLVGKLAGTARVVNCYNFAAVTSDGSTAAGIVGDAQAAAKSTRSDQKGIVFACVNYAKVDAGNNNVYPVVGGSPTDIHNNLNAYNYFNADAGYNVAKLQYDGSYGNEIWALNRVEMVRYILNSNNCRAGWWVNSPQGDNAANQTTTATYFTDVISADDNNTIGQWVLDTTIAPYPILKPRYDNNHNPIQYPSIINPDYEASWRNTANAYEGRRLSDLGNNGYLAVTVTKGDKGTGITTKPTMPMQISITDMDTLAYDFNYAKIQLPYFQDIFGTGSNIQTVGGNDYIVTGWKITSITKDGTPVTSVTQAEVNAFTYNYANRDSIVKDLYHTFTKTTDAYGNTLGVQQSPARVFAQGGYFNVPNGVTAITIEPYWGRAFYLKESCNDVYYYDQGGTGGNPISASGTNALYKADNNIYGAAKIDLSTNQTIYTSLSTLFNDLENNKTVYDQAIVLLTDFHLSDNTKNSQTLSVAKSYTVTSIDVDNNHEPDHVFYHYFSDRCRFSPIRFDNIVYADLSMASLANGGSKMARHLGLTRPTGHYEITETAMAHFYQFEYNGPHDSPLKVKSPFILNGGYFDHITSTRGFKSIDQTLYIHMGGHVYHKQFSPANDPNGESDKYTYRCPVILTGGEYKELYLSGCLESKANSCTYDAILYASGARIGTYASGAYEKINADVIIKADHIIAHDFYAGSISPNPDYSLKGAITTTLDYSIVHNVFCGANKFGDMVSGKDVITNATGTTFKIIYGAGYGGNAKTIFREQNTQYTVNDMYNDFKGYYKKGTLKSGYGINTDYAMDLFPWSNSNQHCGRFYNYFSSLSLASANNVTTTLTDCTVLGNYYGGGNLGQVKNTAKSTLTNCTIYGDVFAGGNAATAPPAVVYEKPSTDKYPQFVGGVYINLDKNKNATSANYVWTNDRPSGVSDNLWTDATTGVNYIYADRATADLSTIGVCKKTDLTLSGNTVVYGSVFGGGNEAETGDPDVANNDNLKPNHYTTVVVKDNVHVTGDVVAAGNQGKLTGSTSLTIGADTGSIAIDSIPWIEGDVYGGAYSADVDGYSNVTIYDGILGPVYAGGYTGSVYKESNIKVLGGRIGYTKDTVMVNEEKTVTASPIIIPVGEPRSYYGVFGAGFGFGTTVGKCAHVSIGSRATTGTDAQHTHIHINGSVFGGGEAGQVGTGFEILHGETVAAGNWYVNGTAGTFRKLTAEEPNTPADEHGFYAQFYKPTFDTTTVSVQAPDKAENSLTTNIAGAVFGGGRGYYIEEDEEHPGTYRSTLNSFKLAIAGAVYGNTKVTVGTEGQGESGIYIGSVSYYTDMDTAEHYRLVDLKNMHSSATFWDENLYVYDVDSLKYVMLDPNSRSYHRVKTRTGSTEIPIWLNEVYEDVMYYLGTGRASVVGGGEMGPVYGDHIFTCGTSKNELTTFNYNQTRYGTGDTTGNTVVRIYSGTLGDIYENEVNGCVYGGGLNANVDGTSTVTVDGTGAWVRGDVYAGGCMGSVYGYGRDSAGVDTITTLQNLLKGWVRNAHGGSNLAMHSRGSNSKLVVGDTNGNNSNLLVSESVYGANGFSPSLGTAEVVMRSGSIGFVRPNIPINTYYTNEAGEVTETDAIASAGTTPVVNVQNNLAYEGNVYGGGFGPEARVRATKVTVTGGNIRNGVFGGGELAPVIELADSNATYKTGDTATYLYTVADEASSQYKHKEVRYVKYAETEIVGNVTLVKPVADVTVSGGHMGMILGGGRGYTYFMNTTSDAPGLVAGDTRVTITGGVVRSAGGDTTYYESDLGGGNVYGGGLEGEVTGNTEVTISGANTIIQGRAFAGGRGYRDAMLGDRHSEEWQQIFDRATVRAGAVHGNTSIAISGTKTTPVVGSGIYGGGEGMNYLWSATDKRDTVATVYGNATVDISGGMIGGGYKNVGLDNAMNERVDNGSFGGGRVASVHGTAKIHVYGNANVAALFGGNDISGKVHGNGGYGFHSVHNSGRTDTTDYIADSTETYILVDGTPRIGRLFGGGNGYYPGYYQKMAGADWQLAYLQATPPVQGKTYVDINMSGTTFGSNDTTGFIGAAFGGGNQAEVGTAQVMLHNPGLVDTLFAGGNSATVTEEAIVKTYATDSIASLAAGHNVKLLFGGNNKAAMYIMPTLDLRTGTFDRVFGGGNAGAMKANQTGVADILGNDIANPVSTYVTINSSDVTVRTALYGGCNQATVDGGTYVAILNTSNGTENQDTNTYGVYQLFGGNDISERVATTRVDVIGGVVHNIYGGSNGHYNYTPIPGGYNALDDDNNMVSVLNSGRPKVGDAHVNIWGGQINSHVYGGGYAGDCENTHVVVDDRVQMGETESPATISGHIYGGGCGILENALRANADATIQRNTIVVGNVTGLAKTDLYHVTNLKESETYAYGGGYGGDVHNTLITMHPEWDKDLEALYGGCYGSNVEDTARVVLNPLTDETNASHLNVNYVYGGNDYTGTVNHSYLTINSGRYRKVFGAGNGAYGDLTAGTINKYGVYTTPSAPSPSHANGPANAATDVKVYVPNSKYPVVDIYGGDFIENVYGGGNLGSCKVDTSATPPHAGIEDYAFVQVNVHGGTFHNDIFAGAAGQSGLNPLINGLKVLNMDGGLVANSVYGGTESVNDGYKDECDSTSTTLRPSSILNLVGGDIGNNVYGGGYLGQVYGSVYVNVGKEAVEKSRVYNRPYGSHDYSQQPYKPVFATTAQDTHNGDTLLPADLFLRASIYAGANWGSGNTNYTFKTRGFHGGESCIRIDGEGYNTTAEGGGTVNDLPAMAVKYSLIGSGTSCEGGDVLRDIRVLNYGVWENASDCRVSKDLWSIQRADIVVFKNVALVLTGDQDAYSAYPSSKFSMTRCKKVVFEGFNVLELEKPAVKIGELAFRANTTLLSLEGKGALLDGDSLTTMRSFLNSNAHCTGTDSTSITSELCESVTPLANNSANRYSTILVDNGAYIDVYTDESGSLQYGSVLGYGFLRAQSATQAIVTAHCKTNTLHASDGGFFGVCPDDPGIGDSTNGQSEFYYGNNGTTENTYRAWKFGRGSRTRQVTVVAHTDTTQLPNNYGILVDTAKITLSNGSYVLADDGTTHAQVKLGLVMVPLELPPTDPGNYYVIDGGITVDQENRELELVGGAFIPNGDITLNNGVSDASDGVWIPASNDDTLTAVEKTEMVRAITGDASHKFGLAIGKGGLFTNTPPTLAGGSSITSNPNCRTAISSGTYFEVINGYATTTVAGTDGVHNVVPTLNVYLTYDGRFTTTLMGDVTFTLRELNSNGVEVGTIDVTISISTILTEFKDQKYELVAMKNGFDNHVYSRKMILPASMRRRSLYLTDLEWEPLYARTQAGAADTNGTADLFGLTTAQNAIEHRANLGQNTFGIVVRPTEDLSNTTTTTLGWYRMMDGDSLDLRKEYGNGTDRVSYSRNPADQTTGRKIHYTDNGGKGKMIGILDGRSSAAIDMSLYYNGDQKYDIEGVRGRAILHFAYYNQNTSGSNSVDEGTAGIFRDTIYVRTRKAGDTIYLCSEPSITRDSITIYPHGGIPAGIYTAGSDDHRHYADGWEQLEIKKGKNPRQYVTSFEDALDHKIYKAGDVIYIIGPVDIKGRKSLNIHGYEYNFIPVMRYPGSHFMFPGDTCAYRGPLVRVSEEGKFSTEYVFFDGNMVSSRKAIKNTDVPTGEGIDKQKVVRVEGGQNVDYYAWGLGGDDPAQQGSGWKQDTLAATAPIFEVKDGGVLTLGNETVVRNSWNKNAGTDANDLLGSVAMIHQPNATYTLPGDASTQYPAHPRMVVTKNVDIYNNVVDTAGGNIPTGAIHLEKGVFQLGVATKGSAKQKASEIHIEDNYEANGTFWTTGTTDDPEWEVAIPTTGTNAFAKANVYLNHAKRNNSEVEDEVSMVVTFADEQNAGSRIGISKEFPGLSPLVRDTIRIAQVTSSYPTYAANAKANDIFFNDGRFATSKDANIFYHSSIAPTTIFFQRCATFQKQLYEDASHNRQVLYTYVDANGEGAEDDETVTILQQPVLSYHMNSLSACPDGTDTVVYSVHGGFYPYTYSWTSGTSDLGTSTTQYSNAQINEAIGVHNYDFAVASNSDTLVLSNIQNAGTGTVTPYAYTVTATDIAGCEQTKHFTVNVQRVPTGNSGLTLTNHVSNNDFAWGDTASANTEVADRTHKGLHLLAGVFPQASYGSVTGKIYDTVDVNLGIPYVSDNPAIPNVDSATLLCPGDAITLTANPTSGNSFIQWDFDPYDVPNTVFVMPSNSGMPGTDASVITINAFFGPANYWKKVVTTQPSTFTTDYWGTVHIHNANDLAWLISLANGFNDQAPRDFWYDSIIIHNSGDEDAYDMMAHLWTPLGTSQHPFSGRMFVDSGVVIKNIIVNEPNMDYVGFFGHTEHAIIENLHINNSVFHGGQYVGGITAHSSNDSIRNSSVTNHSVGDSSASGYPGNIPAGGNDYTMITTNYCSGGLVGTAENTVIEGCEARARYMGAAIYNGGIGGYVSNGEASNCAVRSMPRMSSMYSGGIFGFSTATQTPLPWSKNATGTRIVNNYVAYNYSDGSLTRAGGLVGYAKNTTIANNYVYGRSKGASVSGAIGSTIDDGVHIENCFYEQGFDHQSFGYYSTLDTTGVTSFSGTGRDVVLADTLGRNANLTRQLNRWVYAHGGEYNYWHSDTAAANNGYPVFGAPEYQTLTDVQQVTTCDRYTVEGILCTESGTYQYHLIDSAEFTDTLVILHLTVNYSELTELTDTIGTGEDYDGYGFHLTATELDLMRESLQQEGTVTVVVSDTLQTLAGCDSVVTLYLTLSTTGIEPVDAHINVNVYPNPTTKNVTVEATGLQTVELYDAVSRRLDSRKGQTGQVTFDLEGLPAGAYYLRIRTEQGTVIKKVVKR